MISSASMGGLGGGGSGSMDAQREQDLAQLQREYRHMELNRRAYAEESQQVLRKQQAKLDQLRKENEALKAELALECRSYRKPSSGGVGERIMLLRQKAIDSEAQVDAERQSCVVMQQQIDLLRKKILHLRKVMGGVNAAQENDIMIQKQVRILEDRLDKALMKFNESLSHNKALRQEIDDLRRERVVFEGIQGKLEKELADKKRQMAAIIEQSNVAYEQRDSYQMEAAAIEQADQRERQDFSSQINELTQALDGASQPPARMAAPHPGSLVDSEDTSTPIHRAGASGPWGGSSASDRVDLQASADRVLEFEEAFNRIKAATGIEDIDELVRTFIKNEDQNFSLFNYVNEQQNEIEKLESQIQGLLEEEGKYAQETGEGAHQHTQAIQEIDARLQASKAAAQKYDEKSSAAHVTLDLLKDAILDVLHTLLGPGNLPGDLLTDGKVTESNLMGVLGAVEERTNDLLTRYGAALAKEKSLSAARKASSDLATVLQKPGGSEQRQDDMSVTGGGSVVSSVLGVGPQIPMGKDLIRVTPPRLEDYSSDDEDRSDEELTRPFTHDELKARTLSRIEHRRTKDASKGKRTGQK